MYSFLLQIPFLLWGESGLGLEFTWKFRYHGMIFMLFSDNNKDKKQF